MKNTLESTVTLMTSDNYKDRFIAEYRQLKIRYEKLRAFNDRIIAADMTSHLDNKINMPKHDCPAFLLEDQERIMDSYLRILERRAIIEGIDLQEE